MAENRRVDGRRKVVQPHALYWGEINSSQEAARRKIIEVFETGCAKARTVALFPPRKIKLGPAGGLRINGCVATLVFDIETSALPLDQFDEAQQEYLFRETGKIADEAARQAKRAEIKQFMSLWPFTSQVVCIAMLNAETQRGQTLFLADDYEDEAQEGGPVEFVPCADEMELLTAFWDVVRHYEAVVTFNGRGFDVPFVYLRSALLNVPISRKNWLGYRYATEPHCDLAEQFTFYNVSGRDGAARRFNLDFYCKAFGIESPKSHGVTGMDVATLLAQGKHREIAEYCLRDVRATVALHRIWKERLAGIR